MGAEGFLQILITSVVSILATGGFWTWLQSRDSKKNAMDRLIMGLAYEKIMSLAMRYIERGWVTQDEYDDFQRYLYSPYKALGGNGVTQMLMGRVDGLPIKSRAMYAELVNSVEKRGDSNGGYQQSQAA